MSISGSYGVHGHTRSKCQSALWGTTSLQVAVHASGWLGIVTGGGGGRGGGHRADVVIGRVPAIGLCTAKIVRKGLGILKLAGSHCPESCTGAAGDCDFDGLSHVRADPAGGHEAPSAGQPARSQGAEASGSGSAEQRRAGGRRGEGEGEPCGGENKRAGLSGGSCTQWTRSQWECDILWLSHPHLDVHWSAPLCPITRSLRARGSRELPCEDCSRRMQSAAAACSQPPLRTIWPPTTFHSGEGTNKTWCVAPGVGAWIGAG